jgi:hypothetical protein
MGTDMHGPLIEIGHTWGGTKTGGKIDWWREFACYNWSSRNYVFFDALAGVRGPGSNPIPVKGIPEDTHNVKLSADDYEKRYSDRDIATQEGHWLGYHDHTWLTPDEWEQVVVAYRAKIQEYQDDGEKDGYPKDTHDIRMVDGLLKLAQEAAKDDKWGGDTDEERPIRLLFGFDS